MKRVFDESALIIKGGRARVRGGAVVARQAHNLKVAGSIPAPATTYRSKLEAAYASELERHKRYGAIRDWRYEPMSFKLSAGKRFRPDFMVWTEAGIEFVEVKGRWIKNKRDGMTRLHWAAKDYPMFTWRVVWREGHGFDGMFITA